MRHNLRFLHTISDGAWWWCGCGAEGWGLSCVPHIRESTAERDAFHYVKAKRVQGFKMVAKVNEGTPPLRAMQEQVARDMALGAYMRQLRADPEGFTKRYPRADRYVEEWWRERYLPFVVSMQTLSRMRTRGFINPEQWKQPCSPSSPPSQPAPSGGSSAAASSPE